MKDFIKFAKKCRKVGRLFLFFVPRNVFQYDSPFLSLDAHQTGKPRAKGIGQRIDVHIGQLQRLGLSLKGGQRIAVTGIGVDELGQSHSWLTGGCSNVGLKRQSMTAPGKAWGILITVTSPRRALSAVSGENPERSKVLQ